MVGITAPRERLFFYISNIADACLNFWLYYGCVTLYDFC